MGSREINGAYYLIFREDEDKRNFRAELLVFLSQQVQSKICVRAPGSL